ncbi:reducing type I polyketide synthase [Annulohypoxylon maeteangense]|uniref:reducing type I polyketide synthase n=1 Tax=Annulohypoxylon maeteangense TaxID=1927788 RepID=UPI0020085F8F|nr:reducing type I polyketide synthase [Annulohypoxylon maeteangense]KAI0883761.1 reducing type I polyketide synthase [Annulohypoxylon maeteangense]
MMKGHHHINGAHTNGNNGVNPPTNGINGVGSATQNSGDNIQEPIAIIGMACRLPGHCSTDKQFWDFMMEEGVAKNEPPETRFRLAGHYDGSQKPYTMKTPGAMFMEDVDPADFDAQFFNVNHAEASSMDPQHRNLLEVTYECLENAGIPLEKLSGQRVGCVVGTNSSDYYDMSCRDPENRMISPTMGPNRAFLSNRISHFLNVHGPSISMDTACSSTLTALDMACLYLQRNQVDAMLVGGTNMYFSPERNQDMSSMRHTASATGQCHVFDSSADGYVTAEAINTVFLKRLKDAVEAGDPIRAIIRGTSTNSAGKTPGIAMPNAEAQAAAIRAAYANAGISESNFFDTGYLECHGTGTRVGDPIEVEAVASVFAQDRSPEQPLIIGSAKSNVGHSEGAAGLSGLIKAVLAIENKTIPGTANFTTPNPRIDLEKSRVRVTGSSITWPRYAKLRASINSFGFGGANAHAVIESPEYLLGKSASRYRSSYLKRDSMRNNISDNGASSLPRLNNSSKPMLIVLSANDEESLKGSIQALSAHLVKQDVCVTLEDLAYTLSERRTRLHHTAYSIQTDTQVSPDSFVIGKRPGHEVKVGFVFTGQGSQWSAMGKALLHSFPRAREIVESLDAVLAALPEPPPWSLVSELTEERDPAVLREPEFSQPLVTALQLAYLGVLSDWGIAPVAVVGHSSGEIAAAVAAGYLTAEEGIKTAFFRGQAAKQLPPKQPLGMLAVGISAEKLEEYIDARGDSVQVACFNSPRSLTLSGTVPALERVKEKLQSDKHFARMLQVDFAYHSRYMEAIGNRYAEMLQRHCQFTTEKSGPTTMFSSVYGAQMKGPADAAYWVQNMTSEVRFDQAVSSMLESEDAPNFFVEIGPSNTLAGPMAQIFESVSHIGSQPSYVSAAKRGPETLTSLYSVAGRLFGAGGTVNLASVNEYSSKNEPPTTLIDLPNYSWNHSKKYWHENLSSKDWRYRPFIRHDLLGTKILGTSWHSPIWKNILRLGDHPWLADHKVSQEVIFPGTGYLTMAIEAIYQATYMTTWMKEEPKTYRYRLRDIKYPRALVLEESEDAMIMLSLTAVPGSSIWHKFNISSLKNDSWNDHASGFICIETDFLESRAPKGAISPLKYPTSAQIWYKRMREGGFDLGPSFQKHLALEYTAGHRTARSIVSLEPPSSLWPQSAYPLHPACMDGCFQTVTSSMWEGDHSSINAALVPFQIDSVILPSNSRLPKEAFSMARSDYVGVGRRNRAKNYSSSCTIYHPEDGSMLLEMKGLRYTELDYKDAIMSHTYTQMTWDADITFLSESNFKYLINEVISSSGNGVGEKTSFIAQRFIDMAAHKNPNLSILEINLDPADTSSLWLERSTSVRAAYSQYIFVSGNADSVTAAQEAYANVSHAEFIVVDFTDSKARLNKTFNLAIVKVPSTPFLGFEAALRSVRECLDEKGLALVLDSGENLSSLETDVEKSGFGAIFSSDSLALAYAEAPVKDQPLQDLYIFKFIDHDTVVLEANFSRSSWNMISTDSPSQIPPGGKVLVIDELKNSIMPNLNHQQWSALQELIEKRCDILWVTTGAQVSTIDPTKAIISGLFRVIRSEEPLLNLINLDVEHTSGDNTIRAIDTCLKMFNDIKTKPRKENEFVERNGIIHISRVFSDTLLNKAKEEEFTGRPAEVTDLHASESTIRLRAERTGNIDSLQYSQVAPEPLPLEDDCVEIEVVASGVNLKEILVTMGIVPEDEHLLGGEGSGVITRVAPGVTTALKPGMRVAFFGKGSFGNRVQTKAQAVHVIPDFMSFEEAATIPCVFMTSMYSLFRLARVKRGDRVLIHSATGGVGISAIQLCHYVGAIVYATVGTQEKREFLQSKFGIPDERIFSSRTTAFGNQILDHTDGKGVDIILNSLTGNLLDESWRIIADGGTMVEIGKKDILDRNTLSMEPFGRNASFRAFDLAHKEITDDTIESLLSEVFKLMEEGHLKPISPMHLFSFTNIPDAFRLIRSGKHIGKLVISDGQAGSVKVPVRPAPRRMNLRSDVCYLVVGGLRGLCASLATYLAKNGARYLAVLSRRGHDDDKSRKVISDIRALGCHIDLVIGDITSVEDVRKAFQSTRVPIGGIIQGAMVLRDRIFASMTVEEYHTALACKVQGTWNLHNVSIEQNLNLDFFVMLASISGLCGSKGQANYAAGNTFLNAFASYRQGLGLRACSIDLGVIEDVGYIAEHQKLQERYDAAFWDAINEQVLQKILNFSIQQQHVAPINAQSATHMITGIRVPQPEDSPLLRDARFAGLHLAGDANSRNASRDSPKDVQAILGMLRSKAEARSVLELTIDVLSKYFIKNLRLTESLDATRPLSIWGIDSLAAVEFRNFVKMELGVELTTLEVVNASSLVAVCEKIISRIPLNAIQ